MSVAKAPHHPGVWVVLVALEVPFGVHIVIEQFARTLDARLLGVRVVGTTQVHKTLFSVTDKRCTAREGLITTHLILTCMYFHTNNSLAGRAGDRQRRRNHVVFNLFGGIGRVGGRSNLALGKTPLEDLHTIQEHTEAHISFDRDADGILTSLGSERGTEVTSHSGHRWELSRSRPSGFSSRPGSGGLGLVAVVPLDWGGENGRNSNHLILGVTSRKTEGADLSFNSRNSGIRTAGPAISPGIGHVKQVLARLCTERVLVGARVLDQRSLVNQSTLGCITLEDLNPLLVGKTLVDTE